MIYIENQDAEQVMHSTYNRWEWASGRLWRGKSNLYKKSTKPSLPLECVQKWGDNDEHYKTNRAANSPALPWSCQSLMWHSPVFMTIQFAPEFQSSAWCGYDLKILTSCVTSLMTYQSWHFWVLPLTMKEDNSDWRCCSTNGMTSKMQEGSCISRVTLEVSSVKGTKH